MQPRPRLGNSRRMFVHQLVLLTVGVSAYAFSSHAATGQDTTTSGDLQVQNGGGFVASFKRQLEAGLRARRPQEFAFIARVVQQVDENHLSKKLVLETFQWSRRKRPYPYQYFERAMRIRAAQVGVAL